MLSRQPSRVWLFATPWTVVWEAPLSMRFPRQEYWSGLPFPSPGDLPDPGIEPTSPETAGGFFITEPPGKLYQTHTLKIRLYCCVISHSVMSSDPTLWSYWLQHARFLCPSLSPRVCSNSCPLSQWCYLTIFPSIRVFSSELALCIRWPKYQSFSLSISPSNEHSRLVCFRIDWFDLLAVQGTLKSLLQHHSSKAVRSLLSLPKCW